MSITTCEPKPFQWTRETYERAGELGFFGDLRVELVEGQVVQTSPMGSKHAGVTGIFIRLLNSAFGITHFHLRGQQPFVVGEHSLPEPDIAVVRGLAEDYLDSHPLVAELVVEISETSLAFDRNSKSRIYALAQIPEYWIVNLIDNQIEVFREPSAGGEYADKFIVKRGASISPLGAPEAILKVSELLP